MDNDFYLYLYFSSDNYDFIHVLKLLTHSDINFIQEHGSPSKHSYPFKNQSQMPKVAH